MIIQREISIRTNDSIDELVVPYNNYNFVGMDFVCVHTAESPNIGYMSARFDCRLCDSAILVIQYTVERYQAFLCYNLKDVPDIKDLSYRRIVDTRVGLSYLGQKRKSLYSCLADFYPPTVKRLEDNRNIIRDVDLIITKMQKLEYLSDIKDILE